VLCWSTLGACAANYPHLLYNHFRSNSSLAIMEIIIQGFHPRINVLKARLIVAPQPMAVDG